MTIVTGKEAAKLLTRAGLDAYRRQHRGNDAELDAVLTALTVAAIEWRNRVSGHGHPVAPMTEAEARCALTTARAADRLGCTQRTIVRAIHNGQLPAHKIGPMWMINSADLQHYADQHT